MTTTVVTRLDARRSQEVFRVLLSTLAEPGRICRLPIVGLGAAVVPLSLAVVDSTFAVLGDEAELERVRVATGATAVSPPDAGLVALCGAVEPESIRRLRRGSAFEPELGAKVGVDCERLVAAAGPPPEAEVVVALAGPGVSGRTLLGVDGVARPVLVAIAEASRGFPAGVDVWLVDRDGRVAGIPRSSRLEVR